MTRTEDRIAVVTGAGSGIGRALSTQLAGRGCRLALSDVDAAGLESTVATCRLLGADVEGYLVDVSDRDAVVAHVDDVVDRFGGVELVFNNAGVALVADAIEQSLDDLDRVLGVNLYGVLHGTQLFLPHLIASGDGHVVNISSLFGILTVPSQSAYHTSKFAVRGYTEALAVELAATDQPVRASCVHPGGIDTAIARNAEVAEGRGSDQIAQLFAKVARTSPDDAAAQILRGVERDRTRILVGLDAKILHLLVQATGTGYQRVVSRLGRRALRHLDGRAVEGERTTEPGSLRAG